MDLLDGVSTLRCHFGVAESTINIKVMPGINGRRRDGLVMEQRAASPIRPTVAVHETSLDLNGRKPDAATSVSDGASDVNSLL